MSLEVSNIAEPMRDVPNTSFNTVDLLTPLNTGDISPANSATAEKHLPGLSFSGGDQMGQTALSPQGAPADGGIVVGIQATGTQEAAGKQGDIAIPKGSFPVSSALKGWTFKTAPDGTETDTGPGPNGKPEVDTFKPLGNGLFDVTTTVVGPDGKTYSYGDIMGVVPKDSK
jgi:hypothetical protein